MEETQIQAMLGCLPAPHFEFQYHRDRYALLLLSWLVREGRRVRDIKASRFRGLLDKPAVRSVTARRSNGMLDAQALTGAAEPAHAYRITFDSWGCGDPCDHCQMSRPGKNLVLLLNFPEAHDAEYEALIKPAETDPFVNTGHPYASDGNRTMAWARLDIDMESGEALIEEIQGDWIRLARTAVETARHAASGGMEREGFRAFVDDAGCSPEELVHYWDTTLSAHVEQWSEAMLSAALWFLVEKVGVRRIFYHTYEGGMAMKPGCYMPPQSLYGRLPRQFGFVETECQPMFICVERMPMLFHMRGFGSRRFGWTGPDRRDVRFFLLDLEDEAIV